MWARGQRLRNAVFPGAQDPHGSEGSSGAGDIGEPATQPAEWMTLARMKRTTQEPGRPYPPLGSNGPTGSPRHNLRQTLALGRASGLAKNERPSRGRSKARETVAETDGGRESEGGVVAVIPGKAGDRAGGAKASCRAVVPHGSESRVS